MTTPNGSGPQTTQEPGGAQPGGMQPSPSPTSGTEGQNPQLPVAPGAMLPGAMETPGAAPAPTESDGMQPTDMAPPGGNMQKRPGKSPAVPLQIIFQPLSGYFDAVGNGTGLSESVCR